MECISCKFYLYNNQYHDYKCSIKGCIDYSKYKEFTIENLKKDIDEQKEK